jgi:hypothetical protein
LATPANKKVTTMHGIVPKEFKRQVTRKCECCGVSFVPKRRAQKQLFCGHQCRDADRRARSFRRFGTARRGRQGIPRSVQNIDVVSRPSKGTFGDRPPVKTARSTPWHIIAGPELTPSQFHYAVQDSSSSPPAFHSPRDKAAAIAAYSRHHPVPAPLIGLGDPLNVVGGHRFSQAPKID